MRFVTIVSAALLSAACSTQPSVSDQPVEAPELTPELAPSQTAASTVATPSLPPPCAPAAMMFIAADTGDIHVMNHAPTKCELDLAGTPALSPESEPTVWIEPGATAELLIEESEACDTPSANLSLMVSGVATDVALIAPVCDPTIVAVYPVD